MRSELISQSGGLDASKRPLLFKDKMVAHTYFSQNQRAEWLIQEIQNTRDSMLACFQDSEDKEKFFKDFALNKKGFYENFLKEKFKNHSLASVLSILSLLKNDVKMQENTLLNYSRDKVFIHDMCCFCNVPIVGTFPNQSSILIGEKFKTEIALSTYAAFSDNNKITINGKDAKAKQGVAHFTQKEKSLGRKKMSVDAVIYTKKRERFYYDFDTLYAHQDYYYDVVSPMAFLHTKTNRDLYLGIPQLIDVHIADENDANIIMKSNDLIINKIADGKYTIEASKTGKATLRVNGKSFGQTFYFNVKSVPTPVAKLAHATEGISISKENWQQQKSLFVEAKDFDFEIDCKIESFLFTYIPSREDAIEITNFSENFNSQIIDIQKVVKPKDLIHFTEIKAKCKGDTGSRLLNTMIFEIRQ